MQVFGSLFTVAIYLSILLYFFFLKKKRQPGYSISPFVKIFEREFLKLFVFLFSQYNFAIITHCMFGVWKVSVIVVEFIGLLFARHWLDVSLWYVQFFLSPPFLFLHYSQNPQRANLARDDDIELGCIS